MKILVLGAGRMGSFFVDLLSFHHEVAVFETDAQKLRFVYHALRFNDRNEIRDFAPELLINAVPLKHTLEAFRQVEDFLPKDCIISDIASVKTGFRRILCAVRSALCLDPPDVRPHLCAPRQSESGECHSSSPKAITWGGSFSLIFIGVWD